MIWICPRCSEELGELNGWCEYCKQSDNIIVYNPDKYYIRKIRIRHISQGDKTVTPQEELFAELFNHEKILVKDMEILELRAHREELAKIAFEARARLTAVDDEDNSRKKSKSSEGKPSGFERSLNVDDRATDAINTIKERQKRLDTGDKLNKRLTKNEKLEASLEKLLGATVAKDLMSASRILKQIKDNELKPEKKLLQEDTTESKPIFNPFEKKENQ